MKQKTKYLLSILALWAVANPVAGQEAEEVSTSIYRAVEIQIDTEQGYDYQFLSSSGLTNFQPVGPVVPGNNEKHSMFFRAEPPRKFFKAQRVPSSLTRIIPGLASFSLDTAVTSNTPAGVRISGVRVTSTNYDEDDYLVIDYQLNLGSQCLEPVSVDAYEDLGPTTSGDFFFVLNDHPRSFEVSAGQTPIAYNTSTTINIPSAGVTLTASLEQGQIMGWTTTNHSEAIRMIVRNPDGEEIDSEIITPGSEYFYDPIIALESGDYTIQFSALSGNAASLSIAYHNTNNQPTGILDRSGGSVDPWVDRYYYSYKKYRIQLNEGELLSASTNFNHARIAIFDSKGRLAEDFFSNGTVAWAFEAPGTDNYWLIYFHNTFTAHSSTINYSVTAPVP